MKKWIPKACLAIGTIAVLSAAWVAADEGRPSVVVDIKPNRIILMDIARAGDRLVAVGERGFVLLSSDFGDNWTAHATPVTRTLTAVAFEDDKLGVAVGHGGSLVRSEDGGDSWTEIPMEDADSESLLGVTSLGGGRFAAYGAFGLYFDSTDGGRTWRRHSVISEDFDRHISQVVSLGDKLLMVAESGNLAVSGDMGATWTRLKSPYEGSYFGATELEEGVVVVFGMRGNVYRTDELATLDLAAIASPEAAAEAVEAVDAGDDYDSELMPEDEGIELAWQKIDVDTTASFMAGRLLSDGRLLLVGNSGLMAVSTDNGRTLELHWAPDSPGFAQVIEADGRLITVGERGIGKIDPAWLATN